MSSTPPGRNPKRQRQKEGAQARRAAELAALRRRQRNRRLIRIAVIAVVVVGAVLAIGGLGGDGGDDDDPLASDSTDTTEVTDSTDVTDETTTTVAPVPATPLTCEPATGDNTDMATKPTVTVPPEPATELTCVDLVVGDGEEVLNSTDTVTVHYVGVSQSTEVEFDASWEREPATFSLQQVIAGWTEGIPGMKIGGRRILTIPGDKAYGEAGRAPDIGPNDTLVFIVDLLEVNPDS
jgi:peptidylprolyl isomerase